MPITEYADINQQKYIPGDVYSSAKDRHGFCQVSITEDIPENAPNNAGILQKQANEGWKIHISIDDNDEDNLIKGWRIISQILMENYVYLFKVVDDQHLPMEGYLNEEETSEGGKQITIFAFKQPEMNWRPILQRITEELTENHIQPSYLPISDNPIVGSHYLSYRYESATRQHFAVPEDILDIFAELQIEVPGQLPRREWAGPELPEADKKCACKLL